MAEPPNERDGGGSITLREYYRLEARVFRRLFWSEGIRKRWWLEVVGPLFGALIGGLLGREADDPAWSVVRQVGFGGLGGLLVVVTYELIRALFAAPPEVYSTRDREARESERALKDALRQMRASEPVLVFLGPCEAAPYNAIQGMIQSWGISARAKITNPLDSAALEIEIDLPRELVEGGRTPAAHLVAVSVDGPAAVKNVITFTRKGHWEYKLTWVAPALNQGSIHMEGRIISGRVWNRMLPDLPPTRFEIPGNGAVRCGVDSSGT